MERIFALLDSLAARGSPLSLPIREAMESVPIDQFTKHDLELFWNDLPVPFIESIGGGVKTISAPHMIVEILHQSEVRESSNVLLVGAKGGYLSCLISHIVGEKGDIMLVDPSKEVIQHVKKSLRLYSELSSNFRIRKIPHLNRKPPSLPNPLDIIIFTGMIEKIPNWVEESIAQNGLVIAPIGDATGQILTRIEVQDGHRLTTPIAHVAFGPVELPTRGGIDVIELITSVGRRAITFGIEEELISNKEAESLLDRISKLKIQSLENTDPEALLEMNSSWLIQLWPLIEQLSNEPDRMLISDYGGVISDHDDLIP